MLILDQERYQYPQSQVTLVLQKNSSSQAHHFEETRQVQKPLPGITQPLRKAVIHTLDSVPEGASLSFLLSCPEPWPLALGEQG